MNHFAFFLDFGFIAFSFRRFEVMPTFSGSTLMMALIASSNVNGCRLTGFAFGIAFSETASAIARRNQLEVWRICPAEDVASEASSAAITASKISGFFRLLKGKADSFRYSGRYWRAYVVVGAENATL